MNLEFIQIGKSVICYVISLFIKIDKNNDLSVRFIKGLIIVYDMVNIKNAFRRYQIRDDDQIKR